MSNDIVPSGKKGMSLGLLPPKPSPYIPDAVWQMMQESGALAAVRLNVMLKSKRFNHMKPRDQLAAIGVATSLAYGKPGFSAPVEAPGDSIETDALKRLSDKAVDLPELRGKVVPITR